MMITPSDHHHHHRCTTAGVPFRELTRYGVLLRSFNLPMLRAVFSALLPEAEAPERFQQLTRYPYIESLGNGHYTTHNLVREILAAEIREQEPEAWQRYHKRALEYLTRTAPDSLDHHYHSIAIDQDQGMSQWWDAFQSAYLHAQQEAFGELLQIAQDGTLKLTAS